MSNSGGRLSDFLTPHNTNMYKKKKHIYKFTNIHTVKYISTKKSLTFLTTSHPFFFLLSFIHIFIVSTVVSSVTTTDYFKDMIIQRSYTPSIDLNRLKPAYFKMLLVTTIFKHTMSFFFTTDKLFYLYIFLLFYFYCLFSPMI